LKILNLKNFQKSKSLRDFLPNLAYLLEFKENKPLKITGFGRLFYKIFIWPTS